MKVYDPSDEGKARKRNTEARGQGDMFAKPVRLPMARTDGPNTSKAAANVVRAGLGKIQALVLTVYQEHGPMSARQAERRPEFEGYGFSTIRKRISELARAGLLTDAGIDRSGRAPCTIYAARGEAA